eukprot:scaffold987_cov62-Cylindrotheca_fusiformis.AAC.1
MSSNNNKLLCYACQELKHRQAFVRKQWLTKKFRRCNVCIRHNRPAGLIRKRSYSQKENGNEPISPTKTGDDEDQVIIREKEDTQRRRLLLRAKRFMVQRKYDEALSLCNIYFNSLLGEKLSFQKKDNFHRPGANAEEKSVSLTIQCSVGEHQHKDPLVLRLSWANKGEEEDKSAFFDPFAVVAMQCWHVMEEQHNKT